MTTSYSVPGMSCQHCVNAITTGVGAVPGVEQVAVDLESKTVTVAWTGSDDSTTDRAVRAAIDGAGYEIAASSGTSAH